MVQFSLALKRTMYDFKNSFFPNFLLTHRAKYIFSRDMFCLYHFRAKIHGVFLFSQPYFNSKSAIEFIKFPGRTFFNHFPLLILMRYPRQVRRKEKLKILITKVRTKCHGVVRLHYYHFKQFLSKNQIYNLGPTFMIKVLKFA